MTDAASVNRAELARLDHVCPECATGKHAACDAIALDPDTDEIGPCLCTCNEGLTW